MLIKSKTDLINYLNEEIGDIFVINAIMAKLGMVKEEYNIGSNDPYKLEICEIEPNKYSMKLTKIDKIESIKVATMIVDVE